MFNSLTFYISKKIIKLKFDISTHELVVIIVLFFVSLLLLEFVGLGNPTKEYAEMMMSPQTIGCELSQIAFCDIFTSPSSGGRSGELDNSKWSVSRWIKNTSIAHGQLNEFYPTDAYHCRDLVHGVVPDKDSFFCGVEFGEPEHWMTAFNDGGQDLGYGLVAGRIRQQFSFSNRVGHIVFDVDAKAAEGGPWTEVWITDQPIPAPHSPTEELADNPHNGIGLVFDDFCNNPTNLVSLGSVFVYNNYTEVSKPFNQVACVATLSDDANHFEIRISQNHLEVWASDHDRTNFRLVATADNLNLPLTQGYVTFEHASANREKFGFTDPSLSTYHWHNIGFDGPTIPQDRGYDVPDALTPSGGGNGDINLGYAVFQSAGYHGGPQTSSGGVFTCCTDINSNFPFTKVNPFTLNGVDVSNPTGATLNMNVFSLDDGISILYQLNGNPWRVYSNSAYLNSGKRTISIPVTLSDLKSGTNTLDISSQNVQDPQGIVISNIDLTVFTSVVTPAQSAPPSSAPPSTHTTPAKSSSNPTPTTITPLASIKDSTSSLAGQASNATGNVITSAGKPLGGGNDFFGLGKKIQDFSNGRSASNFENLLLIISIMGLISLLILPFLTILKFLFKNTRLRGFLNSEIFDRLLMLYIRVKSRNQSYRI